MADVKAREAKLIQYLNEAYGTEKRLETALTAHITMATRAPYKKRLQQHLTETKRHGREVSKRVKQLGGTPEEVSTPGPEALAGAAQTVVGAAQRAAALAQGPLHALRGTGASEKQLKNAKTEYASEAEEIATYSAIETLAEALNDKETARLAKAIRREEERMSAFLEKEIGRLAKAVVREEIPAAERRAAGTRPRRRARAGSSTRATSSSSPATRRKTSGTARGARSSGAATKRTASSRGRAKPSGGSRSGSSRATGSSRTTGSSRSTTRRTRRTGS
jgi:ferritin-like metal-binding protein YciE